MRIALISLLVSVSAFVAMGQHNREGTPLSWSESAPELPAIIYYVSSVPNPAQIWEEDAIQAGVKDNGYRFAIPQEVSLTPAQSGRWTILPGGSRLWQLGIQAPGALSLGLTFGQIEMPEGAKLFVYDPSHSRLLGDFGSLNTNTFSTTPIDSDRLIIEYFEPAHSQQGSFVIEAISYGYRPIELEFDSDNLSCVYQPQPEAPFQNIAGANVSILTDYASRVRTGVLVNSTQPGLSPYLLTSELLPEESTESWLFVFNADRVGAGQDPYSWMSNRVVYGAELVQNYVGQGVALLHLNRMPLSDWKPYYCGWDLRHPQEGVLQFHVPEFGRSSAARASGVDDSQPGQSMVVRFWDEGTTFSAATGSGLFLDSGSLVGIMTGGKNVCGSGGADFFVPLGKVWNGPTGLKSWLNPGNDNQESLEGRGPDIDSAPAEGSLVFVTGVYPNPASEILYWNVREGFQATGLILFDSQGRIVQTFNEKQTTISFAGLDQGVYFLQIWVGDIPEVHRIVVVR